MIDLLLTDLPIFNPNAISNTINVVEGRSYVLICNVTSRPASAVTWSYDSVITATQSNPTATNGYYIFSIGVLSIPKVTSSMDREIVTCTGTPVYGSPIHRSTTLIIQCKLFSIQFFFSTLSIKALTCGNDYIYSKIYTSQIQICFPISYFVPLWEKVCCFFLHFVVISLSHNLMILLGKFTTTIEAKISTNNQ